MSNYIVHHMWHKIIIIYNQYFFYKNWLDQSMGISILNASVKKKRLHQKFKIHYKLGIPKLPKGTFYKTTKHITGYSNLIELQQVMKSSVAAGNNQG